MKRFYLKLKLNTALHTQTQSKSHNQKEHPVVVIKFIKTWSYGKE